MTEAVARGACTHLVLVGPTATGKSALALLLAEHHPGLEIVSADSMMVYRTMDVGTAKPSAAERAAVAHHLIDVVDPAETFSVGAYQKLARAALADIEARGKRALIVGGTGLYIQSVVDEWDIPGDYPALRAQLEQECHVDCRCGDDHPTPSPAPNTAVLADMHSRLAQLDPVAASRIEPTNARRIIRALEVTLGSGRPFSSYGPGLTAFAPTPRFTQVGLRWDRAELDARIASRYAHQLDAGFVAEVEALAARPGGLSATARQALGYRELLGYLHGAHALDEAVDLAVRRTCQFARRQERWFRRDPRISWLDGTENSLALTGPLLRHWQ